MSVAPTDHVAPHRRTVTTAALKIWLNIAYPKIRPQSLFGENEQSAPVELTEQSKLMLQNMIGAMLNAILGTSSSGTPNSEFGSQARLIEWIVDNHQSNTLGLSKRTLEKEFAAARRALAAP